MSNLLDKTTQLWVKWTGKKIDPEQDEWLLGPIGDSDKVGDQFISRLEKDGNLDRYSNQKGFGLSESIDELGLSTEEKDRLNPIVADFYEHTYNYHFEFWSEWTGIFRPFGWLLAMLFSRRLQQLNLPLSPMDASKGLNSNIIKLKQGDKTKWTIWYRTLKANQRVIYSGVYTTCTPNVNPKPHLKVVFPLPNGNASVVMTKTVENDGSLLLSSDGQRFGENGFYFTLIDRNGNYWAKYVKAMHEWIRVYVDKEGVLQADHTLNFYGFRFLNLHYKMWPKPGLN